MHEKGARVHTLDGARLDKEGTRPPNSKLPRPLFPRPAFQFHPIATCMWAPLASRNKAPDKKYEVTLNVPCNPLLAGKPQVDLANSGLASAPRDVRARIHYPLQRRTLQGPPPLHPPGSRMHEMHPPPPCYPPFMQVFPCLCFSSTFSGASLSWRANYRITRPDRTKNPAAMAMPNPRPVGTT